ncbi:16S rRNA (cytidine(1402)-2'-O)-methyltransferase [Octadecabacter sp. R77987]|uniref:16S rRNA (cytidine(1402)-2'-O)-methyltransferase n=1 Tax=Octadecabacter sp. R77987 TaxID=3093874 RepID=UPI00366E1210
MIFETKPLSAGLYFVATPIGAARDITLRGLDILASADVIAAEDTRTARKLMDIHGVPLGDRQIVAYHDHSSEHVRARLMANIADGKSVAYVSEAGTPLVADPGFALGRAAITEGYQVIGAPGASAVLAALTVSGLPSDRFLFAGFLPNTDAARRGELAALADVRATLVFYELPKRVGKLLSNMCEVLGAGRSAVVCRELTKKFEEVQRGTLGELSLAIGDTPLRGEVVVLVDRGDGRETGADEIEGALRDAMKTMRVKDAATAVAGAFGLARRDVYQMALKLEDDT